jgi:hypothetical protein
LLRLKISVPSKRTSPSVGRHQPQNDPAGCGFAAPRFADQTEDLSRFHRKADAVHGLDLTDNLGEDSAPDGEVFFEVVDF